MLVHPFTDQGLHAVNHGGGIVGQILLQHRLEAFAHRAREDIFHTLAVQFAPLAPVDGAGAGAGSSGMLSKASSIALRVWSEKMSEWGATFWNTRSSAGTGGAGGGGAT